MVFPGRFSTGCLRCRQRKVKCDEGKPSCRRCAVYGKPCTGYTDQFHFKHSRPKSDASTLTQSLPYTQVRQQSISPSPSSGSPPPPVKRDEYDQQQQRQHEQSQRWDANLAVVRAPEACYDDVSLFYFVRRFVSPNPADGFPGHLSFLPSLYNSYSNGLLETATLSVAQMAAYNTFGGDKFRVQSYKNYGKAIRMLRDIVQSEDQATDDKVITSILLLCTLKDISGDDTSTTHEHAPGLFYLIEKRGPEQISTSRGAELLFLALIRLQIHAFLHDDDTYVDPGAIATVWGAFDPLLRAMTLMSRTLSLRHRLLAHYTTAPFAETATSPHGQFASEAHRKTEEASIVQGCFEILEEFSTWDAEAALFWQSIFAGRGVPTALGQVASGTIAHYDRETACTIILIRSARLILLMTILAYYHGRAAFPMADIYAPGAGEYSYEWGDGEGISDRMASALAQCLPILEQDLGLAIDDILASVPYALGDVDPCGVPCVQGNSVQHDGAAAIVILHCIRLVASCAYATEVQTQRAVDVLVRLNSGMGIRAAVGVRPADLQGTRWAAEQTFLRSLPRVARSMSPTPTPELVLRQVEEGETEELVSPGDMEWFSPQQWALDDPFEPQDGALPMVDCMAVTY